jgi:hypothetical protein
VKWVLFAVIVAACIAAAGALAQDALANTRSPVPKSSGLPTGPCETEDDALSIEIIGGVWFECSCEHMPFGKPVCDWYEITSAAQDPRALRKWLRRHPAFKLRITVVSWG